MNRSETIKFFAQLVHAGLLDATHAKCALETDDPVHTLVARGIVSAAQWREWVETKAGTQPRLTRYEIVAAIGEGGEARVFRAVDRTSGQVVALKVLRTDLAADPAAVNRFVAEAKLLIALDCENIVKGIRVAREGAVIFSVMQLIEGRSLQERLAESGPLEEDEALDVVRQLANALAALHERGLVHRDVKPGNILRTADGRVVLIDLGFATRTGTGIDAATTTAGTAHYISPEQARGHAGLDVRADIYSLGATLYHLLTGSLPFAGGSSEEVMAKQVLEALSGEQIRSRDLSPQVHFLIEKMMAKDKEIRFQEPRALAAEVDAILEQRRREAELRNAGLPTRRTARPTRRRRRR